MQSSKFSKVFIHVPNGPIPDDKEKGIDWLDEYNGRGHEVFMASLKKTKAYKPNHGETAFKPSIIMNGIQESELLEKIRETLVVENQLSLGIFIRGKKLVETVQKLSGLKIEEVSYESFKFKMINLADWKRVDEEGAESDAWVSERIVKQLFGNPPEGLERLDKIIRVPFFNSEGEMIHTPGYHRGEGVYLDSNISLAEHLRKKAIGSADVEASKQILVEMLKEFSFKNESDRLHYIAALLHPIVRLMFRGPTPLMFIDASAPRSGKTLLAEILSIIQLGEILAGNVLSSDEAEQRKLITGLFRSGAEIFYFDNVRSGIDSIVLAKAATQDVWSDRVLGSNEIFTIKNDVPWIFTINGFSATGEIVRRSPRIRIVHENNKKFDRDAHQLKEWVRKNRNAIVGALCTLVQHWVNLGRPLATQGRQLSSFEAWSNIMGGIFDASNMHGFLEHQSDYAFVADDEAFYIKAIFSQWHDAFGETSVRPTELLFNNDIKLLFIELLGTSNPHALPGAVGVRLKTWVDRIVGGYKLGLSKDGGPKRGRVYELTKFGEGEEGSIQT